MSYTIQQVINFAINELEAAIKTQLIWEIIPAMAKFTQKREELKVYLYTPEKEKCEKRIEKIFLNLPQFKIYK